MAKDTYKSPVKPAKSSIVRSNDAEAPVPDSVNQDATRAENPKGSYDSVDIILEALADKIVQRMKAKKLEDSDPKPAAKPKAVSKPKVDESPVDKPEEKPDSAAKPKPAGKADSAAKLKPAGKAELKLSPNPAAKKAEVAPKAEILCAPVAGCSFVADGPGSVYCYKDWKTGKDRYTLDPWVARQASGNNWEKIFVWFENGQVHHKLSPDELQMYCLR